MTKISRQAFFFMPSSALRAASFLACFMAYFFAISAAFAIEPKVENPSPVPTASHKVAQSTPIDKLIQTLYANSPLNTAVLRQALVEANPKVITGNPQQRLKAGTVVVVPEHIQIVRNTLMPIAAPAAAPPENSDSGPTARDNTVRKPWVRYP
jgi:Tfp pilus assembly protein FimV